MDENQIPKIEDYPKNTFILFNAFEYTDHTLNISEIDVVIGDNYLITVSGRDSTGQPILKGIEHYVESDLGNARQGPAYLLHVLLDRIVDQKFVAIEAIEEAINESEDVILTDIDRFNPADLLHLRRNLVKLRKSLFHEREILVKICRKDCPYIPDKAILYYRDVYDHLAKFFELTESSRDIVTSLMEMHVSLINNRMTKTANNTNIDRAAADLHHHHLYAAYPVGRDRRYVGMVHDDRSGKLEDCIPVVFGRDGGDRQRQLLSTETDREEERKGSIIGCAGILSS